MRDLNLCPNVPHRIFIVGWFRSTVLRVMSPTRFLCATTISIDEKFFFINQSINKKTEFEWRFFKMFYQEAISWHAIEIPIELSCFNYEMLSSLIVLYCSSSIRPEGRIIKRLIYHYPTHF